jgi:hypothetical protein
MKAKLQARFIDKTIKLAFTHLLKYAHLKKVRL